MRRLSERQQADALYQELRRPPLSPEEQAAQWEPPTPLGAFTARIRDGMLAEQAAANDQRDRDLPDLWGGETNG